MDCIDPVIGVDYYLESRLASIRKLDTSVYLAEPKDDLYRRLLHGLLGLDDGVSGLHWLEQTRSDIAALIALVLSLQLARRLCEIGTMNSIQPRGHDTERGARQAAHNKYFAQYGDLIQSVERSFVPSSAGHVIETVERVGEYERLVPVLTRMRRLSHLEAEASPSHSIIDPGLDTLLADLLRLPDSTDPLQWLIVHRRSLTARLTLAHVLATAVPMTDLLNCASRGIGVLRSIRPTIRTQSHGRLKVSIRQIDVMEGGFAIKIKARLRIPKGWVSSKNTAARWEGFNSVRDSNGGHYIVQMASVDIIQRPWWWTEHLTLACWPALEGAHELIFDAHPACLSVYKFPMEGSSLVPTLGPILGEVSCTAFLSGDDTGAH